MGNDYLPRILAGQLTSPLLLQGLDAMSEWLVVVDSEARIVYLNTPYAAFLEVDAVAAIGRPGAAWLLPVAGGRRRQSGARLHPRGAGGRRGRDAARPRTHPRLPL